MIKMLAKIAMAVSVVTTAGFTVPTTAEAGEGNWMRLCRPFVNNQIHGGSNSVQMAVRFCAEVTNIVRGYGNDVDVRVIGPNLVSVTSLGDGNESQFRINGADNVIGTITRNGGRTLVEVDGSNNQMGGYNNGCDVRIRVKGSDNGVFTNCSAD